jgi:hypothetical protein
MKTLLTRIVLAVALATALVGCAGVTDRPCAYPHDVSC